MKKRLISLDADGTLWYPKKTKRSVAPHWLYENEAQPEEYLSKLRLIPGVKRALKKLKKSGYNLIVVSTNPYEKVEADRHMAAKIDHFNLSQYFDEVFSSPDYPEGKGEVIEAYLTEHNIPKEEVIHIGDSYKFDFYSMSLVDIDCVLIETPYTKYPNDSERPKHIISGLHGLPKLLGS